MTATEAKTALNNGKKLTHRYFSQGEWICKNNGKLIDETGTELDEGDFWIYRMGIQWQTGWEIVGGGKQ